MKKLAALCLVVLAGAFAVACSESATSTPVSAETSELTSVTGAVRNNSVPVLVCHFNEDWEVEEAPPYVVIEVDDNSAPKHCSNHVDFTTGGAYGCTSCDLTGAVAGDDCTICAVI